MDFSLVCEEINFIWSIHNYSSITKRICRSKYHRKILYQNLEKHGLLNSDDVYIKAFIEGGIWQ